MACVHAPANAQDVCCHSQVPEHKQLAKDLNCKCDSLYCFITMLQFCKSVTNVLGVHKLRKYWSDHLYTDHIHHIEITRINIQIVRKAKQFKKRNKIKKK